MNSTAEILKAARKLIEKPENWTQGRYARDKEGNFAPVLSPQAHCFCSVGAIARVMDVPVGEVVSSPAFFALNAIVRGRKSSAEDVEEFNDSASHRKVMNLFSKAIAAAEASS